MGGQNGRGGEDIAEQIRRALSDALELEDFGQLNRMISDTVDSALGEARQQFERYRNRTVRQTGEPVGSQEASWVPEEAESSADGAAGSSGASAGEESWRRGTRRPGDDGRYHYGTEYGTGSGEWTRPDTDGGVWKSTYSSEPYSYGGMQAPAAEGYRVRWKGRISGVLMSAVGALGTSAFGMLTFVMIVISLIAIDGSAGWIIALLLGLVTGGFGLLLWSGVNRYGRVHRLKQYLDEFRRAGRPYCEVSRLGHAAGKSESFTAKDLKKILALGMLPDARMDDEGTYLMMDEETYRQYEASKEALRERQEQEKREQEKREQEKRLQEEQEQKREREEQKRQQEKRQKKAQETPQNGAGGSAAGEEDAVDVAIARGEEQMEALDRMRQSLPVCRMTAKLERLDRVLERLFATLRKYPDQLDELERFMEYYLPTTVKLVTAYSEFAAVEFPGDNVNGAMREIEKTMDTINGAFEKLLDDMYEDTAFDVMADASVLQTVLKSEGLTEGDFRKATESTQSTGGNENNGRESG